MTDNRFVKENIVYDSLGDEVASGGYQVLETNLLGANLMSIRLVGEWLHAADGFRIVSAL
jgi:hypothetical protein